MSTLIVTCEICRKIIICADKTSFSQEDIDAYQLCSCNIDGTTNIQITVDGIIEYITPLPSLTPEQEVQMQLFAAQQFGDSLIVQFATENALAGFSTDQLNSTLTQLTPVMVALESGALLIAIERVNALIPDGIVITTVRITQYRNLIQSYLSISLT